MNATITYRPGRFFLISFFFTFVLWGAGAYASHHDALQGLYMVFMLPGLLAPFLVSTIMIFASRSRDARREFRNRLLNPRLMDFRMVPVFLFLMRAVVVVSTLLSPLVGEPLCQFQPAEAFLFSAGFIPVLMLLLLAATFEELGWRGYAFDSLQSRYSFLTASIVFGVLWSAWHLPLLFVKDSYQYELWQQSPLFAVNFFLSVIPLGVIISWVGAGRRSGTDDPHTMTSEVTRRLLK